jgi:hypothetical protein
MTLSATDSADVEIATHFPSADRYVLRGTENGIPAPRRGWR